MPSSVPLFRVAGIQIGIHSSWVFALALISWSLAAGYFPQQLPGLGATTYWSLGIISALLLFASVLVHELAHSLVARRRGLKVDSITLFIFGGVSNLTQEPLTPGDEFAISIVGPLSSLILAGIFFVIAQLFPAQSLLGLVFGYLAFVNATLGVFNLVPGFPLDGGRVFRSIVWGATGSLRRGTLVASYAGQAFGWLLIAYGVVTIFATGGLINGVWTAFIGWFLNNAAESTRREQTLRETLTGVIASTLMDTPPVVVPPDLSVQDFVLEYVMRQRVRAAPVVDASGRVLGIVSVTDARHISQQAWPTTRVDQVMTQAPITTVGPSDEVGGAIGTMAEKGLHQLPVVQDGRVLGMLNREHVLRWIQLKHDLAPTQRAA